MLLRAVPKICSENSPTCNVARRLISQSALKCQSSKTPDEGTQQTKNVDNSGSSTTQKFAYPKKKLAPRVVSFDIPSDEAPWKRVGRAFKYDYDVTKNFLSGKMPPPFMDSADILIIGGGFVGSAIAYHLTERTGPGLNVMVVEKDPPGLSSSLKVAHNGLYQQHKIKPSIEMAQYAADFYRKLNLTFCDPDIDPIDIDFFPNNSLQLVSENEIGYFDALSELYKQCNWRHQLLTSSMLKQRFPWMNVNDIGVGCLGLQKEGICDQYKSLSAIRAVAKRNKVKFIQGEVIGFEYIDQTDLNSTMNEIRHTFTPRKAVIQTPSGEIIKNQFGYVIVAAGASVLDIMDLLSVANNSIKLPVEIQKCSSYEITCPDGPGLEMPMVIEANGLKYRKKDFLNNYVVWDDQNCDYDVSSEPLEASKDAFAEKVLPQLIHRVPSFKDAKLISAHAGLIEKCVWDDYLLMGPVQRFHNVIAATGFGNDEFLFAPAVGQGIAEIILDREFIRMDLSCFRFERVGSDIKLNDTVYS